MSLWQVLRAAAACTLAVTLLGGCGGGSGSGGSGGTGGANNTTLNTTLAISPTALTMSADAGSSSKPTTSFTVTISNSSWLGSYFQVQFSTSGISSLSYATSGNAVTVTVNFQDPSVLGPGVYNDTLEVYLCTDSSCTAYRGAAQTVTSTYTVTGSKPPPPSVAASTTSVTVQALPLAPAPSQLVTLTLQGIAAINVQYATAYSTNGIASASAYASGANTATVQIGFQPPSSLAPGVYNDTITVKLCATSACPTPLAGSPITLTTQYTVGFAGQGSATINAVAASATDLAWDSVSGNIFFSSPSFAASNPNSVVALDPTTGSIGTATAVGSQPATVAVSDDGSLLYVALMGANEVQRLTLPALNTDITLSLGSRQGNPLYAGDLQVQPGASHTVAASLGWNNGGTIGASNAVAVFDDGTERSAVLATNNVNYLQWGASSSVLYGSDANDSSGALTAMQVDAGGVESGTTLSSGLNNYHTGRLHYVGGALYTDDGRVTNPTNGDQLGLFAAPSGDFVVSVAPDEAHDRLFALIESSEGCYGVQSYDLSTYNPLAQIALCNFHFPGFTLSRLIRWGTDGLAVATSDGHILLISGTFVTQ